MKHLFLTLVALLALSFSATAQITAPAQEGRQQTDQKYLAGAVPERNGHVYLTRTLPVAPELSQAEILQKLNLWIDRCMKDERVFYHQPLPQPAGNELLHSVIMRLTFSRSVISHDFSDITYVMHLTANAGQVVLELDRITYKYREGDKENRYPADDLISDRYAINKKGRLVLGYRKFRIKTIDFMDELFASLEREFQ